MKPIGLVGDAIRDVTRTGDRVLDPFAGSGTTLLAAELTHRHAACIELDPKYVDVILRRFEAKTSVVPVHMHTGATFTETVLPVSDRETDRLFCLMRISGSS